MSAGLNNDYINIELKELFNSYRDMESARMNYLKFISIIQALIVGVSVTIQHMDINATWLLSTGVLIACYVLLMVTKLNIELENLENGITKLRELISDHDVPIWFSESFKTARRPNQNRWLSVKRITESFLIIFIVILFIVQLAINERFYPCIVSFQSKVIVFTENLSLFLIIITAVAYGFLVFRKRTTKRRLRDSG